MLYFESQADKAGRVTSSAGEIKMITHNRLTPPRDIMQVGSYKPTA